MGIEASWKNRQVLVCGGSSGFGLNMVIALSKKHAKITIISRDQGRLESARKLAIDNGANSVNFFALDMLRPQDSPNGEYDRFQGWCSDQSLDLLINAIGRSDRGHLEQLTGDDMIGLFQDNVICSWNMTRMCLPQLRQAKGTIVNIGSLAGIVATPNMGGYSIAKSALTAMTRQLRLELSKDQIHVLLVCPGPIQRDDSQTRYQELATSRGMNSAAAAPGGGAKLKLIDPVDLCDKILRAAELGQHELIYPSKAKWLASIASVWPSLADSILKRYIKP